MRIFTKYGISIVIFIGSLSASKYLCSLVFSVTLFPLLNNRKSPLLFSRETYPDHSPSILSDVWLAVQGPRDILVGSTWEWKSRNYSSDVSAEEASTALEQLLPKASAIYPKIKDWSFVGAKAGIRAMPPLTSLGSLPVLGRIDDLMVGNHSCQYWFFGGLGARGLLYHGLLGKLMAQAVLFNDETLLPVELTSWKR